MKMAFTKATPKDINGTGFAGYLQVSYELSLIPSAFLTIALGKDEMEIWRSKNSDRVGVQTKNKRPTVIRIYDYKDPRPFEDIDLWHVGIKGDPKELEGIFQGPQLVCED